MLKTIDATTLAEVTGGIQPSSALVKDRLTQIWGHQGSVRLGGPQSVHGLDGGGSLFGQGKFFVDSPIRGLTEHRSYTASIVDGSVARIRTQHINWQ